MAAALWQLPATELASLLARGEVSSREVVLAHLARIDEADAKVRAFTTVFRQRAVAAAERADDERRRGEVRGPLHGLPVTVKECFDVDGLPTTLGLPSWRSRVATRDAAMVTLLREAGAVILGRTNVSQTMLFPEARNPLFGQTNNPFSLAHSPGGSSGGEAAAIAAGLSPLGIGTDVGGSIRVPAHQSGVAGLKPTLDRLPSRGQRTVLAGQEAVRSQAGPLARTVGCLALFMRAFEPRRMSALDPRVPPMPFDGPASGDRPLRVGFYDDDGVFPVSRALSRAVGYAREALGERGYAVVPFVPPGLPQVIDAYLAAVSADGGDTLEAAFEGGEIDPVMVALKRAGTLPSGVRRTVASAMDLAREHRVSRVLRQLGRKPVADLWRLTAALREHRFSILDAMDAAGIDLLVCPPFATPALPHGMSKNFTLALSHAMVWNAVQFPAGVVPVTRVRADEVARARPADLVERQAAKIDKASAGLPVGVQVVGRPWRDGEVLAAMAAIEEDVRADPEFPVTPVEPRA